MPRGAARCRSRVVLGAIALVGLAVPASSEQTGRPRRRAQRSDPAPPRRTSLPSPRARRIRRSPFPSSPALVAEGYNLYESGCSSCHGIALHGTRAWRRRCAASVPDRSTSTSRPAGCRSSSRARSRCATARIQPQPDRRDHRLRRDRSAAPRRRPRTRPTATSRSGCTSSRCNCAGCHQDRRPRRAHASARSRPTCQRRPPQEIAEAVRMGPYLMPHFDASQIDQHELDSIARYVLWTRHPGQRRRVGDLQHRTDPRGDGRLVHRARRAGDRRAADRRAPGSMNGADDEHR